MWIRSFRFGPTSKQVPRVISFLPDLCSQYLRATYRNVSTLEIEARQTFVIARLLNISAGSTLT